MFQFHCHSITRRNGIIFAFFVLRSSDFSIPPVRTFGRVVLKCVPPCLAPCLAPCRILVWFWEGSWTKCETRCETKCSNASHGTFVIPDNFFNTAHSGKTLMYYTSKHPFVNQIRLTSWYQFCRNYIELTNSSLAEKTENLQISWKTSPVWKNLSVRDWQSW